jgi:hypothetical protein
MKGFDSSTLLQLRHSLKGEGETVDICKTGF